VTRITHIHSLQFCRYIKITQDPKHNDEKRSGLHNLSTTNLKLETMASPRQQITSLSFARKFIVLALILISSSVANAAYRIGDTVDTLVWTSRETTDAMRAQMPLFGLSNSVTFPQLREKFSLGFDQGLWALPWLELSNRRGHVDKLIVTFVYSSNGGTIHAVSSEVVYHQPGDKSGQLKVEYVWREEEPVDITAGSSVMFLAVMIVSVIFLVQSCGIVDEEEGDTHQDGNVSYSGVSVMSDMTAPGVPKWD
jgi:hypothetical protein